jgi:hypothetical protein
MTDEQFKIHIEALRAIYTVQKATLDVLQKISEKRQAQPTAAAPTGVPDFSSFKCPICGGPMAAKKGKNGSYFAGCKGYPNCRGIRWEDGSEPQPR